MEDTPDIGTLPADDGPGMPFDPSLFMGPQESHTKLTISLPARPNDPETPGPRIVVNSHSSPSGQDTTIEVDGEVLDGDTYDTVVDLLKVLI